MGYSMPADAKLRGDVKIAHRSRADRRRTRWRSTPPRRRSTTSRSGSTDQDAVPRADGDSSPSSAPSASAARRTSAARRRRTSPADRAARARHARARTTRSMSAPTGGVSDEVLAKRLDAVVPDGAEAVTGAPVAKESSDAIKRQFKFVSVLFTIFAGIALFVGSFIIWNTFTMIVTQRSREIALLRAVGATRRQVMHEPARRGRCCSASARRRSASALGVGVAKGLNAADGRVGFSLPSTSMQINPARSWCRCSSAPSSPSSRRSCRPGGRRRCCRSRRCARRRPGARPAARARCDRRLSDRGGVAAILHRGSTASGANSCCSACSPRSSASSRWPRWRPGRSRR